MALFPAGIPAWSVGNYHNFEFTYVMATGVATWKIDFNRDGDFLDANESASSTSPTLAGYGHKYLNLWMTGSSTAPGTVDVQNFTVNGTNLGGFTSNPNTTAIEWTWKESSGLFTDVTVTGEYRMSANGSGDESNRMWVRLGGSSLPAKLSATTSDALICTGETTTVSIDLANIADLYGYQFQVSYDATMTNATGAFVNSFFDLDGDGNVPGGIIPPADPWNAKCTGGTCSFARTEVAPDLAVSGSGQLAQITLTGVAPGTFAMKISGSVLSDIDGVALYHELGADLPITVCGLATVSGYVTLQGRPSSNVDGGTVSMFEQGATPNFPAVAPVAFSATNGAYSIQVPYMPGGTSYKIRAEHGLYLGNEEVFTVNGNLANKNTRLWGGDANNDARVSIGDLSCIGGAFGISPITSTCGGTGSPNINADAVVNIQDLSITGGNFDKCSYQPWNTALPGNYNCPTPLTGQAVISSSAMSFSDGGWGGWSCPAGKVVVGGGFQATAPVAASAPGTPGSVWPHYTYGPAEYGWVVQDAPDGVPNTITIRPICADPPPGYQVIKAGPMSYSGNGWAGWSCPAGKIVTGGGFENPGAVWASAPGTPSSVWPHYTYGASEYGWVVQNGGVAGTGYVYPICAAPVAGYQVVKAGPMSYSGTGWAGWSCPSGLKITGGGFENPGTVLAASPATPGSVWPHYTYGAGEYGWVVQNGGAAGPGFVYPICVAP